jgi:hypothetical protein
VTSRREEKERRRAERIAAEQAAAQAEARRRRLGIAAGAVLAIAAVAAVVYVIVAGGGGAGEKTGPSASRSAHKAPIPAQRTTDLQAAVTAAGCQLRTFTPGPHDRDHVTRKVHYKQNPPVFGPHYPMPASDGDYVGQGTPRTEMLVHALEHGRIEIQYRPGLDPKRVAQLETLYAERPKPNVISGYNTLLFANRTGMPFEVAATAWTHQLGCRRFNDGTFDALRAFRAQYLDKAPEYIPQPE